MKCIHYELRLLGLTHGNIAYGLKSELVWKRERKKCAQVPLKRTSTRMLFEVLELFIPDPGVCVYRPQNSIHIFGMWTMLFD